MKKKYAIDLAKDYEFENESDYYQYIVDSLINGKRSQVKQLFNQMKGEDKEHFLVVFLDPKDGYQKSVLNICIGELCK